MLESPSRYDSYGCIIHVYELPQTASQQLQTGLAARAAGVSRSPAGLGRAGVAAGARRSVFKHKFENRVRG